MIEKQLSSARKRGEMPLSKVCHRLIIGRHMSGVLVLAAVALLLYGLAWNFSTRRYLKRFAVSRYYAHRLATPDQGNPGTIDEYRVRVPV